MIRHFEVNERVMNCINVRDVFASTPKPNVPPKTAWQAVFILSLFWPAKAETVALPNPY